MVQYPFPSKSKLPMLDSSLLPCKPIGEAVFEIIPHQDKLSVQNGMCEQRWHGLFRKVVFPAEQREGDLLFCFIPNHTGQRWAHAGGMPNVQYVRSHVQSVGKANAWDILAFQGCQNSNLDQQQKQYAELIHHYHYPAAKIGFFRLFLVPRQD